MLIRNTKGATWLALSLLIIFTLLFAVACVPAAANPLPGQGAEVDPDHGHGDENGAAHDHASGRIANEGAVIRIVSPADGATFQAGEQIIVEIETENFELGEDGNHCHVYIDGSSWGMVMGRNASQALSGVAPGEHEISVYLSVGTHEELQEGDSITIAVEG